ncbi:MAG: VPLPA-CTERM sorting domain-containing protein [Steroidobacteraceae bacterium]
MNLKIMAVRAALGLGAALSMSSAQAAISSLDLSNYQLVSSHTVAATELSGVTWNWDTGTLFAIGDEGDSIVELSNTGTILSSMSLTNFDDTEGLTYIGNGKFVVTEERLEDAYLLTYAATGSVSRSTLPSLSIGATVGNVGIEGISYDPLTGNFVAVKEKSPEAVYNVSLDFTNNIVSVSDLFNPASLGTLDLSDVQMLSTVSFAGSADEQNLLVLSQESKILYEVTRAGTILSQFDLSGITPANIEGVTITGDGTIFLVSEGATDSDPSFLYELKPTSPVPLPAAAWLLLWGLGGLGLIRKRKV